MSDQGVRKNLYQKVCHPIRIQTTAMANDILDCGCVPGRLAVLGPDLARSERDEEEVRERVDEPGLSAASRTLLLLLCCPPPSPCTLPAYHYPSSPSLGPYPLRAAARVLIVLSVIRVSPTLPYQYIWLVCYSTVRV